jgi:hypothetical protein
MCVKFFSDTVSEKYLNLQFSQFGNITHVTVDRERGHALIYFEQVDIYFRNQALWCMSLECSGCYRVRQHFKDKAINRVYNFIALSLN